MAKKYISEKIRMKSESRLAAVQATYMIAVTENPVEEVIKDFVDGKVGRYVIAEKSMDKEEMVPVHEMDAAYFTELVKGVHSRKEEIEKSLNSYLGKGWTFERMDGTLQALLLCAIYEITTTVEVDVKVIIKEYVDLAYAFFTKQEPKMVNALLDQVAHSVRDELSQEEAVLTPENVSAIENASNE